MQTLFFSPRSSKTLSPRDFAFPTLVTSQTLKISIVVIGVCHPTVVSAIVVTVCGTVQPQGK